MYFTINDVENKIYSKNVEREAAFKSLNELTVKGIKGHVMNALSETEVENYLSEKTPAAV